MPYHVRCGDAVDAAYDTVEEALHHARIASVTEAAPCYIKDPAGNFWNVDRSGRTFQTFEDVWRVLSPAIGGGLGLWATVAAFRGKPSTSAQVLLGVWAIWAAAGGMAQGLHHVTQKRYGGGG